MFVYKTEGNREVAFVNEAAYEAACDWYNAPENSKRDILSDYASRMDDGAIFEDDDCTRLTDDWADLCMAAWARDEIGRAAFVWRDQ